MIDYELFRARRKTISIKVTRDRRVVVRAPVRMPKADIEKFVISNKDWIEKSIARRLEWQKRHPEPDDERKKELIRRAKTELPLKVERYAKLMGLYPAGIKITSARTRFGSCSGKNSICFSWRLMEYPEEAIDYVVVHELAHIAEKNHGPSFWKLVGKYMPDYPERRALLKE